jgi:predicted cupin superfamily sugar epimerase
MSHKPAGNRAPDTAVWAYEDPIGYWVLSAHHEAGHYRETIRGYAIDETEALAMIRLVRQELLG